MGFGSSVTAEGQQSSILNVILLYPVATKGYYRKVYKPSDFGKSVKFLNTTFCYEYFDFSAHPISNYIKLITIKFF
mgnify:CR=1 FL=1